MAFFLDRNRDAGDDRWLLAKVRIFAIGAALALGGMFLGHDLLIWAALGVLGLGMVLRVVESRRTSPEQEGDGTEAGDPEEER
ncbi:MAG: hypothetical protein EA350_17420 [Gemmatimonadales bacterium]|nr:MAG: hypothetical protein EA350_17420 [Gemmatimonadales bacterium]